MMHQNKLWHYVWNKIKQKMVVVSQFDYELCIRSNVIQAHSSYFWNSLDPMMHLGSLRKRRQFASWYSILLVVAANSDRLIVLLPRRVLVHEAGGWGSGVVQDLQHVSRGHRLQTDCRDVQEISWRKNTQKIKTRSPTNEQTVCVYVCPPCCGDSRRSKILRTGLMAASRHTSRTSEPEYPSIF